MAQNSPSIDIKHIAKLANLTLTPEEEKIFPRQLTEVLEYISQLQQVDTSEVKPTHHVSGLENIVREDKIGQCLTQEQALSQASSKHNGFFKAPSVFKDE